jgi:hypothetical protein
MADLGIDLSGYQVRIDELSSVFPDEYPVRSCRFSAFGLGPVALAKNAVSGAVA